MRPQCTPIIFHIIARLSLAVTIAADSEAWHAGGRNPHTIKGAYYAGVHTLAH